MIGRATFLSTYTPAYLRALCPCTQEKATTKKRLGKARGQTRVRELKGLKSDAVSTNNSHVGCLCDNVKCFKHVTRLATTTLRGLVDPSSSSSLAVHGHVFSGEWLWREA